MKIVVDTNVLVSGIFWGGKPGRIMEAIVNGKCELLVTPAIVTEYLRVINELAGSRAFALILRWSRFFNESATVAVSSPSAVISSHSADQKFLDCAIGGKANLIVSGDIHLLSLKETAGIQILTPAKLCLLLER